MWREFRLSGSLPLKPCPKLRILTAWFCGTVGSGEARETGGSPPPPPPSPGGEGQRLKALLLRRLLFLLPSGWSRGRRLQVLLLLLLRWDLTLSLCSVLRSSCFVCLSCLSKSCNTVNRVVGCSLSTGSH